MQINYCLIWEWAIQILSWIIIILFGFSIIEDDILDLIAWPTVFIYPLYIITMLLNPIFSDLRNLKNNCTINEYLSQYLQASPTITFIATSYHYESRQIFSKNSLGQNETITEQVRVNTLNSTQVLKYYSSKDISGLLYLDQIPDHKKDFIKLHLDTQINMADAITHADYIEQKETFWKKCRFNDVHMDYSEIRSILGHVNDNCFIRISSNGKGCHCLWMYLFWVIVPFAKLYHIYFERLCVNMRLKVRKVVSTRFDLGKEENCGKYSNMMPMLKFDYDMKIGEIVGNVDIIADDLFEIKYTTEEEIENAIRDYGDCIQKYKVDQNGVVSNDGIIEEDYSKPPKGCEEIDGDIALPLEKIKRKEANLDSPLPIQQIKIQTQQEGFNLLNNEEGSLIENDNINECYDINHHNNNDNDNDNNIENLIQLNNDPKLELRLLP